ncbi:hypothetical protein L6R49_06815 [Myxococcota bacterium]|nr:hypothetical protein [Myxococcota bacterium]
MFLFACGAPPAERAPAPDARPAAKAPGEGQLSATAWLTRASLDLRGVRPSSAELAAVAADPDAAEALILSFVDDARFARRAAWSWNDRLHTALNFKSTTLRGYQELNDAQKEAAGYAPLALVEWIVAEDQPVTALVTSATLPLNDDLAAAFGLSAPGQGADWVMSAHEDARPPAGLLTSTSLWLVVDGDATNHNRRRANAVSSMFLCLDFLDREAAFDFDLSVEELAAMEEAVRTQPACLTCHAGLDPLAALFGGFAERSDQAELSRLARYSPWRAQWSVGWRAPAYFGRPVGDLTQLGATIAADPRFGRCAARTLAEGLVGAPLADDELAPYHEALLDGGMSLLAVARAVVTSERYRRDDERALPIDALSGSLAHALGLSPEGEVFTQLVWSLEHRRLGGGGDDHTAPDDVDEPGVGHALRDAWLARSVATLALTQDAARAPEERILWIAGAPYTTDEVAARQVLVRWRERLLSERLSQSDPGVEQLLALWTAAGGAADPEAAWTACLELLLRHPLGRLY